MVLGQMIDFMNLARLDDIVGEEVECWVFLVMDDPSNIMDVARSFLMIVARRVNDITEVERHRGKLIL
jgi:hypothetical protein